MIENEQIGGFKLNYSYYSGTDMYSDGDIEDSMLEVCKNKGIKEELMQGSSWPMLYHLSRARENILEWYEFEKDASLLEIGSGCGALTGLFGRKLKRVVGIELSRRRSLINAHKNGDDGKAEIYVGNFQDVKLEEKFDYVTLIGVLEYSKLYINADRPFDAILNKVKGYLKPNGRLIIAIENKMGLKYFAGASEDHSGIPYDGINGYVKGENAITFSKPELKTLLEENGFSNLDFYYPVPDYKLPFAVYSDEYLPQAGELRGIKKAYAGWNYEMFNEETAFDTICRDGQFAYFSNSFLVFATYGGEEVAE